jgi:putative two-component system response regulator
MDEGAYDVRGSNVLIVDDSELEQRVTEQARSTSQMAIIFAFAKLAEARDDDTGRHMERIRTFGRMLAGQMRTTGLHVADLTTTFIDNLHQTAALHDIGKVDIPDAILLKPEKLTPEEFVELKKHSAIGANTLATVLEQYTDNRFLRMGVDVARSHHKKWDGSGYPDNLKRAAIPLAVRIVAAADFYDALTSKRCCRPATSHVDSCRMIRKSSGTHFDLDVVAAFSTLDGQFRHTRHAMQS